VEEATDVVIDRDTVNGTSIKGSQGFEDDFEAQAEDKDEVENEADGEDTAEAAQLTAKCAPKEPAKSEVKHVSAEEARMKMQGVIRTWLLETVGEKGTVKPV
jgi:hypothetical protein